MSGLAHLIFSGALYAIALIGARSPAFSFFFIAGSMHLLMAHWIAADLVEARRRMRAERRARLSFLDRN